MSKLEQNSTSLDEVLAMVNALPNAGSGGGASVETCTLKLVDNLGYGSFAYSIFTCIVDGEISYISGMVERGGTTIIENVARGSNILLVDQSFNGSWSTQNAEMIGTLYGSGTQFALDKEPAGEIIISLN